MSFGDGPTLGGQLITGSSTANAAAALTAGGAAVAASLADPCGGGGPTAPVTPTPLPAPPGGPSPMPQPVAVPGVKGFAFLPIGDNFGKYVDGLLMNCAETNQSSAADCVSGAFFPAWPAILHMADPVYAFRAGGASTECGGSPPYLYTGAIALYNMNGQQPFTYTVSGTLIP